MAGLFSAERIEPSGDAAIDKAVAVVAVKVDLWIVSPALLSGFGVESDEAIESGCEIESAVHKKGRSLKAAALSATSGFGNVASVESPSDFQGGDVVAIDVGERRIAHSTRVVAVVRPGVACIIRGSWRGSPAEKSTNRQKQDEGIRGLRPVVHP